MSPLEYLRLDVYRLFTGSLLVVSSWMSYLMSPLGCTAWMSTGCLLVVYWLSTGCLLVVYWLYTGCLLVVYWLSTGCLLVVYWLSTGCLLVVYWLSPHGCRL